MRLTPSRALFSLLAVAALVPHVAHADGRCPANDDFTTTGLYLPVGCPLVVYSRLEPTSGLPLVIRQTTAEGATSTITPSYEQAPVQRDVQLNTFSIRSCDWEPSLVMFDYERFTVDTTGLEPGTTLGILGRTGVSVVLEPPGLCPPEAMPRLECSTDIMGACVPDEPSDGDDGGGGCSTSSPSLVAGALALALVRKNKTATR